MSSADPTDEADLLVAAAHDVAAFEAVYRRYVRRVTAFAAKRCSSADDVADVVAQTFIRLLDAAERYDPARAEPGPFLLGIAANVVRDVHRRGSRQQALVDRLAGRHLLNSDDAERIDAAIDAARAAEGVRSAVDAVPAGEQEVLLLVAGGRTPTEAAEELGISPAAARTRLTRARRRVRSSLADSTTTDTDTETDEQERA